MSLVQDEPVAIGAAVSAFAVAAIGLADVIWEIADPVVTALNVFVGAAIVLGGALVRSKVTPV